MKKQLILVLPLYLISKCLSAQSCPADFTPFLSVKTNLVYWTGLMPDFHHYTPVPNLEVEWYFKGRWSLAAIGNYAKWSYGQDRFFGISAWSLEPRWWPGAKDRYRWFFLGVYAEAGDYDLQHERLSYDGCTGRLVGSGLSVGAAVFFNRHWGIEAGVRGGYRHDTVNRYTLEEQCPSLEEKTTADFWGVTGLKLSLYYRFALKKSKKQQR